MATNTAITLKKSGVSGNTPLNLKYGEIAINYSDGKLYYKNDSDIIKYITNQDTFGTINSNGQLVLATSPTDILNIVAGNLISISTNTVSKTITLNSLVDNNFKCVELVPREYVKPEYHIVTANYTNNTGENYLENPYRNWCIGVGKEKDLGL